MTTVRALVCAGIALISATLYGQQAGPGRQGAPPPPAPVIDLSGYWTPVMHEDAYERGAGNGIADYGGFALNEAGRLWALSYDPSRVTLRHHQCEGYVTPYQMRSTGNFRLWEDRDPRTQRLISINLYSQTTEGLRTIWMDGRPHPPAWAPHTARGFSTGRGRGQRAGGTDHAYQAGVGAAQRPARQRPDDHDRLLPAQRRSPDQRHRRERPRVLQRAARSAATTSCASRWTMAPGSMPATTASRSWTARPDYVPHYLFGKQPFAREFATKYNLPLAASLMGAASIYPELRAQTRGR